MSKTKKSIQRIGSQLFLQEVCKEADLEPGIYKYVGATMQTPAHLVDFTEFSLPSKIYGRPLEYLTEKVLNTFKTKNKSVGVLLSGIKGTGKSLQLKHLAMNSNMPCIIISDYVPNKDLLPFIESLPSSCMFLFDEFEKVYGKKQDDLLPILDGICSTPHVFVLTVNGAVSEFLTGRPGRIRYNVEYSGLGESIIREIVDSLCKHEEKKEEILNTVTMMTEINMDSLVSFIEEINLYPKEPIEDVLRIFNLDNPFNGEFKAVVYTTGLFLNVDKYHKKIDEYRQTIMEYIHENYPRFEQHHALAEQIHDPDALIRNVQIYNEIVSKFPDLCSIDKIYASIYESELDDFFSDEEIYMRKAYGMGNMDKTPLFALEGSYLYLKPDNLKLVRKNKKLSISYFDQEIILLEKAVTKSYNKHAF